MSFVEVAVLLGKEEGEIPRVEVGCLTKPELQERFGIGSSAVRSTLVMGDLPTKQRLYDPEQVERFETVRQLRDVHQLSYLQIASILYRDEADQWLTPDIQPGSGMTKRQLMENYGLKRDAVIKTFRACGVETWKRVHHGVELHRFEKARHMVEAGTSLAEVSDYFKLSLRSAEVC